MTESFSIQSATRSQSPLTRRDVLNRFASTAAGVSIAGLLGAFTGSGVARANTTIAPAVSSGVTRARLDQTAPANITLWLLPSDPIAQTGLIKSVRELANSASHATGQPYNPNVLLPTHYGDKFPGERGTARDLRITSVADVRTRRRQIEAQGVGFGAWGVPLDTNDAGLAAEIANAAGYYVADVEPFPGFWIPGDDPAASQEWVDT